MPLTALSWRLAQEEAVGPSPGVGWGPLFWLRIPGRTSARRSPLIGGRWPGGAGRDAVTDFRSVGYSALGYEKDPLNSYQICIFTTGEGFY